uniref:Netrin 5 n=1 Tax=Acanthochromis polyacanthus TaxID=80966 RepID=A0A3Q1EZA0_9TELE
FRQIRWVRALLHPHSSTLFGVEGSFKMDTWTSPHDPCYHPDGRPRHCLSEFINAAYGVSVNASHSLQGPDNDSNITTLTDLHNPHNLTCWMTHTGPDTGDWVLTLPLGRRFEITYISLQFCHQGEPSDPISISILKSMDYGRTWRPMQHYSSNCLENFRLPSQTIAKTRHQETEPLCSDPRPLQRQRGGMVLAFSTLDGRPSSPDFDYSPTLQDWVTATDIRVVFHQVDKLNTDNTLPPAFTSPAQAPLALSDLQVGGRCKCNGHASRCRRDDAGHAVCVCEHHTAGPDCDVCEDFYFDRPWHRATPTHPNPCVACECNGHSNKCRFSMEVFQQSGRRSGGVCQKCRHHTAGRHCQYCQNGYTRDHSKPLNHRKACQPCQCHPLGAVGRWCNQTSGQCLCRDGVTGLRCNRCAPGYKQGRSPLRPCIRKFTTCWDTNRDCLIESSHCATPFKINYIYFPEKRWVALSVPTFIHFHLKLNKMRSGPWWQFSISVQTVFRIGSTSRVRRGPQSLWVPDRDLGCGCPALHVGRTFLLIGAEEGERGWGPEESRLVADRSTLALQWREHWSPKLRGFRGQDKRGRCPPKSTNNRQHSKEHRGPQSGYIPPHLLTEKDSDPHGGNTHSGNADEAQASVASHTLSHTHRPAKSTEPTPSAFSTPALVCSTLKPE